MKLILLADVKGRGKANDLVDVNDGYGRNYMLKQKLAKEAVVKAAVEYADASWELEAQGDNPIAEYANLYMAAHLRLQDAVRKWKEAQA